MNELSGLARAVLAGITPYEPGKPIAEVQREYGLTDVVKLASNENPLGPSPMAVEAVRAALGRLNRYPDAGGYYLKEKLAGWFKLPSSMVVLGNGSAELVELVTEAFVEVGDEAVIGRQAFFKYCIAVQIMNGVVVWAQMPELTYDAEAILARVTSKTKVLFIANPNNPTGTLMEREQVDYLMARLPEHIVAVFDEAYWDYRDPERYPDILEFVMEGRNVVVLRTFSKSYGLAGLRIGYALTTEPIAQALNRVREAFNTNLIGQIAATAALDDEAFLREVIRLNAEGKRYFYRELERLGLEYAPTDANFVLIRLPLPGREFFGKLLRRGVIVRPVDGYGLPEYVRVTIGLPAENERFFGELEGILREEGHI